MANLDANNAARRNAVVVIPARAQQVARVNREAFDAARTRPVPVNKSGATCEHVLGGPARAQLASTRGLTLDETHGGSKELEWAEGDTRLNRIITNNFEPEIEKLGGTLLLQQLRDAHKDYGEALGITAQGQDPTTPSIREPLQAFVESLRAYVLTVAAHAVPEDPSSGTLTDTLLAPLYRWQSYVTVSTQPEPQPAPPAPTQPPAPAPVQVAPTPAAATPAAPTNGPSAGGAAHS